jgi:hypothetical protein
MSFKAISTILSDTINFLSNKRYQGKLIPFHKDKYRWILPQMERFFPQC